MYNELFVAKITMVKKMMTLNELFVIARQENASDLHIGAGVVPMVRVDGEMRRLDLPVLSQSQIESWLYNLMNDEQMHLFDTEKQIDFSITEESFRCRVNIFCQQRGLAATFRFIAGDIPSLEDLDCPAVFSKILSARQGLIIVTGATGSGKSTTLAAMINYLNKHRQTHILTLEDPVEFIYPSEKSLINQRELHKDTPSFQQALRAALREDPDVILLGEMRDLETIRLALTAAETGHLVLTTLHTNSAAKAVNRIIDSFPGGEKDWIRSMLSESLQAVISQCLLKKVSGGRVAAWEVMLGIPAIRNLIREGKIAQMYSTMQTSQIHGMQTLDQSLKQLLQLGIVSMEEAKKQMIYPEAWN